MTDKLSIIGDKRKEYPNPDEVAEAMNREYEEEQRRLELKKK